ncbi:uncharacterized protein PGTG_08992 [Puccinia graminis f. sp. tritici CRL 75-36-700-3]|uniref:Calponin-homology (CH) domain-containing protein n=1 Tax=Puccinia graminis f. sp. tritici (strain CRL 75-36-700-3 / race SCCL) TaxID=418459 RepID=E3KE46_PUCGT|nr:uncharacterized protein PGTG_08992 [Puccinia graminis f. sp. tritici CRL 75-36-700-3]EFP82796.1 hypothetical protein PGTG_08992 [Puccinia graminis f. sp. tritici CRL 75-36-700-3]
MANKLLPFPSTSPPAVSVVAEQAPSSSAMENQTSDPPQRLRMPYYTPLNPRQFSSSAAKRESVMALGSIAHLQHYFVRNGLATKNRSASHRNMILAVPGRDPNQLSEEDEEVLQNLPPEPAPPPPKPSQPQFPAGRALPNLTDLESARQEVMAQLDQVCESWGLVQLAATRAPSVASNRSGDDELSQSIPPSSPGLQNLQLAHFSSFTADHHHHNEGFIINLISLTTRAVRSVQKFILTIPDPDIFSPANISNLGGDLQRRMSHLELSTAARPRISRSTFLGSSQRASSPSRNEPPALISRRSATGFDPFALFKKRAVSGPMMSYANSQTQTAKDDPLAILRKMSLEVLTCLKDIEHKFRIPGSATPMDNQEFSIFQSSDQHQRTSPPQQHSLAETKIVEQDEDNSEGSLILPSMSWEYRQDVSLEEVRKEALVVKEWLECVDGILEGMKIITGSRRKKSHLGVKNQPTNMKKKSGIVKDRNVFKKIINSSKFSTSNNAEMKVPDISLDDGTMTEDESYSEMEDEEDSEELLPDWARNDRFLIKSSRTDDQGNPIDGLENDPLGRLFSCLVSHLPHELLSHLVPPHGEFGSRIGFLDSLSDGTLLCLAYNTVLRKSQRPWGFIPVESIHNLVTLTGGKGSSGGGGSTSMVMSPEMGSERSLSKSSMGAIDEQESMDGEDRLRSPGSFGVHSRFPTHTGSDSSFSTPFSPSISGDSVASSSHTATQSNPNHLKVGLTFRRMENIKVWAAALKLRYLIKGEIPLPKTKPFDQSTPPNSQPQDPTSPPNPTIITATNTNNNSSSSSHDSGSIVKFDPKMIAKKSDGWDLALVYMASKWLDSIKAEKREEVLFSK